MKQQIKSFLASLLKSKAIIFGLALLNFILSFMYVRRVESEIQFRIQEGKYWPYLEHWNPALVMQDPILLLIASVSLLISQWWSYLIAILASGRIIYTLGYVSWRAAANSYDLPMFSWQALRRLWYGHFVLQPQYLFEFIIATIIFGYASILLSRLVYRIYRLTPNGV